MRNVLSMRRGEHTSLSEACTRASLQLEHHDMKWVEHAPGGSSLLLLWSVAATHLRPCDRHEEGLSGVGRRADRRCERSTSRGHRDRHRAEPTRQVQRGPSGTGGALRCEQLCTSKQTKKRQPPTAWFARGATMPVDGGWVGACSRPVSSG